MIQVNTTFHTRWGKAEEFVAWMKAGIQAVNKVNPHKVRLLTDLSGESNTIVVESEHESLAAWEQFRAAMFSNSAFQESNRDIEGLILSGSTDYYTIEAEF
jgi:hypothetical protein